MLPRDLPPWVSDYVGWPYAPGGKAPDGVDCWGLLETAYNAHSGRTLPPYEGPLWYGRGTPTGPLGEAASAFASHFTPVSEGSERLFDAILMRVRGQPMHVGLVVAPGWMLHSQEGADSVVERYRPSLTWERRIMGFYRHE